jgi:hypothetical protein
MEDEAAGGQQANVALEIQRGDRQRRKAPAAPASPAKPKAAKVAGPTADGPEADGVGAELATVDPEQAVSLPGGLRAAAPVALVPQVLVCALPGRARARSAPPPCLPLPALAVAQKLEAAFKAAAEAIAERSMALEDQMAKWLRRWCEEWDADLEARPEEVKDTPAGERRCRQGRAAARSWGRRQHAGGVGGGTQAGRAAARSLLP